MIWPSFNYIGCKDVAVESMCSVHVLWDDAIPLKLGYENTLLDLRLFNYS